MKNTFLISLLLCSLAAVGQFDPAAGKPGSLAMYKDSSAFVNWAKTCTVTRGVMDITDPDFGEAGHGWNETATGKPDGSVLSLGDYGSAIIEFHQPITNGKGPDFAVFENSLWDDFLELAFVEVSSDGQNFYRFPAESLSDTAEQVGPFDKLDPTNLSNLAGKHRADYGTPFDLELLKDSAGLDVSEVTHVKIIDVIGNIDSKYQRTYDSKGRPINDPFPTPFPSCGFDLDAIGVIHENPVSIHERHQTVVIQLVQHSQVLRVTLPNTNGHFRLYGVDGRLAYKSPLQNENHLDIVTSNLKTGIYLATFHSNEGVISCKFQIR